MRADDHLEAWKRARAEAGVPAGFADRVMDGVRGVEAEGGILVLLSAVLASRPGRVALLVLGMAAFTVRVTGTLAVLFTS